MRLLLSLCFCVYIFGNTAGRDCEVPENTFQVWLTDRNDPCTSIYLKKNGNYSNLGVLIISDQRPTTDGIYSLIEQLKVMATSLSKFQFHNDNALQTTFDLGKFAGLKKLNQIDVTGSYIDKVIYSSPLVLESMNNLIIHSNRINSFDVEVYKNFPSITTNLHLASNRLSGVFDLGDLRYQKKPFFFSLENNKITHLINTATTDIHVQALICQSNKIGFIDFNIFNNFSDLTLLELVNNEFSGTFDLANFRHIKKLVFVSIGNGITRIINSVKMEMPTVRTIDLKYNKLVFLDLDDFRSFINLESLSLERNKLVTIAGYPNARSYLPKIQSMKIPDNEFYCFQLEFMLEPHNDTLRWYEWRESSCPGEKNVLFKGVMCCYPYSNV